MTLPLTATLLIADDPADNLYVLSEHLHLHYRVPATISGENATAIAKHHLGSKSLGLQKESS